MEPVSVNMRPQMEQAGVPLWGSLTLSSYECDQRLLQLAYLGNFS